MKKSIFKAQEIKDICREIWPNAFYITQAQKYLIPDLRQVENFLKDNEVNQLPFIEDIMECELFALFLLADVKRLSFEAKSIAWALAKAFGIAWNGEIEEHGANVFLAYDDKDRIQVYCLEPQLDEIWIADPQKDMLLLIDFC